MVTSARKVVKTRDKDLRLSPGRRRSLRGNNKLPSTSSTSSSKSSDNAKTCWVDRGWKLFLTTAHKVCVWDDSFCSTVFTSGSQGILAAKRSKDGSILAVADAQIVILHKVDKGQHQSYRLKGAEGNCRLLQYAHDSKSLFFTDSIHNSVQTYSLREDRVNEAAKSHPSAITSFCVSADSNFLLSCSSDPPVIQLHNRNVNNTVDIKPKASSKPVVCCTFHPTRNNIFVLAFADGVLAAYDSTRLIRGDKARSAARKGNVGSGGGEHIHFFRHLHDASISGGAGITGVEFIPGYRARAVSVGEDGRLFIVDFEKKDVLGSWHVGAPATCASVRQAVGKDAGNSGNDIGWMVAVGTIHGKCFVFDGGGTKICEQTVDAQAGKVLDVEWVSGDVPLPPAAHVSESVASSSKSNVKSPSTSDYPESISSAISLVKPSTQILPSLSEHNLPHDTTSVLSRLPANPPILPELPNLPNWSEVVENSTASYLNMFSPVKKKIPTRAMSVPEKESENLIDLRDPKERAKERADQRSVISAPLLWDEKPTGKVHGPTPASTETSSLGMNLLDGQNSRGLSTKSSDSSSTNQVETVIRPPSVNESYHSETKSLGRPTTSTASMVTDPGKLLSDIRNIRGDTDRGNGGRGLALFAPYMSAGSNARRGVLKNYVVSKKANAGDESTLSVSNVSSDVQSGSMDMIADKSVDFDSESMINDEDSIAAEEKQNSSNVFNEDGAEEKVEKKPFSVEAAPEQISDEEDIWLIQGLDDHNYSSPNLNSKSTTLNKGEPLKRKAPVGDEYKTDYAMQSATKSSDTAKRIPRGSKVSAGTGSTRSPSGSNKSRKLSYSEEEEIGKKTEAKSLPSSLQDMNRTTGAGWEEVITQMTNELKKDIKVMHKDMIKRFEEQKKILNELSQEIKIVRTENEGLRKELFEIIDRNASGTLVSGGQGK